MTDDGIDDLSAEWVQRRPFLVLTAGRFGLVTRGAWALPIERSAANTNTTAPSDDELPTVGYGPSLPPG